MISLSYSSMVNTINCPHTWLNHEMKLKTFQTDVMIEGLAAHRIIQDHVSGIKINPLLSDLPLFPLVENEDFDPKMKFEFPFNEKYKIIGFTDGRDPKKGELLEIKTGKKWSPQDFQNLIQWKIYGLALPDYKKVWLVNTPKNPEEWTKQTIRIFNTPITSKDLAQAHEFIEKAIYIIEHINDQQLKVSQRSRYCFYIDCPFGCEGKNET